MSTMSPWLLLVISLPTQGATARMRIWRALKAHGCAALRDGAYLLPATPANRVALQALADECIRETGSAWLMAVGPASANDDVAYRAMFDRRDEHAAMASTWKAATASLAQLGPAELTRLQRKLRREREALCAIDFFPGDASAEAEAAWAAFSQRLARVLLPDEPHGEAAHRIARLDRAAYQGRLWATRRKLWVDRAASAWLIRRFIDPAARFQWLAQPSDCPREALGFDFDGAAFTHVGDQVTFEVLLASFGLDDDPALTRLGAMVHALDVGGEPVPEGSGFEAMLAGARERLAGDDALLAEIGSVLDSLYTHFQAPSAQGAKR